jgi:hypothetical protein
MIPPLSTFERLRQSERESRLRQLRERLQLHPEP